MKKTLFTDEQMKAICTEGDLLVSASAGSGKTAVLVERIIRIVLNGGDVERLLVVTFTEAAASEMRLKINDALNKLCDENPNSEHLRRQLQMLQKAQISTIHAFCISVIRNGFHLIGLDPGFKIADENEIWLLKNEVLEEIFLEEYEKGDNTFFDLVEAYGDPTGDESLKRIIKTIYDFLRSQVMPEKWLKDSIERFYEIDVWEKICVSEIQKELTFALKLIERALFIVRNTAPLAKYLNVLENEAFFIDTAINQNELSELYRIFSDFSFARLSPIKTDAPEKEEVMELRKQYKEIITDIIDDYFIKPYEDMKREVELTRTHTRVITRLLSTFFERLDKLKREKNICDFSDLEHFCLDILTGKNRDCVTDFAKSLQKKYIQVMIDEYQDTNSIQELILSSVSNNNRFMVGDVKQSIYKFRLAKPEIFLEKYHDENHQKVILPDNFRSSGCVVDAVNFFFGRIMSSELGGLDYKGDVLLRAKAQFPSCEFALSQETDVIMLKSSGDNYDEEETIVEDLSKVESECLAIAESIDRLFKENRQVYDKGTYRPLEYRDIVILSRSTSEYADLLPQALKPYNIPIHVQSRDGFYDKPEVKTLLSFLQVIDNPLCDIELITVLHSPIYKVTPDELLEIKAYTNGFFYDGVVEYLEKNQSNSLYDKLKTFIDMLNGWRKSSLNLTVSEVMGMVIADTGLVQTPNLCLLDEFAQKYESSAMRGLFHFLKYIDRIKENGQGEALSVSDNDNVVRLMTIHKSKGLEFPVVFVCGLSKRFNRADTMGKILLHQDLGLALSYVDLEKRVFSKTLPQIALSKIIRNEALSEEVRVLYVALTRAKEKLILTGFYSDKEHPSALSANCFMDWIRIALKTQEPSARVKTHVIDIRHFKREDIETDIKTATILLRLRSDVKEIQKTPAKLSISEIKTQYDDAPVFTEALKMPEFLIKRSPQTALLKGTVTHALLERIDFCRHRDSESIKTLASELVDKNILDKDTAQLIDINSIERMVNSALGERIRRSPSVKRETPFTILTDANHFLTKKPLQDNILISGIIDLFFEEDGELVLVDYKTDRAPSLEELERRYDIQMKIYKTALERGAKKTVKEIVVYPLNS